MTTQEIVHESEASRVDNEPLLEIENLQKHYSQASSIFDRFFGGNNPVRAVDGVSFELYPGETMAIVGESGCGKSTLGKTILNLHEVTGGEVRFRGDRISDLSDKAMRPYRKDIQMIYQDPLASLNPRQSVREILLAPMEIHGICDSKQERVERATELLEKVGLGAEYLPRYPHEFSGGQQQRIGIARALTLEPELLIADEPTSALDVSVQAQIVNLLDDIQAEFDLSILFITHDLSVVKHVSDRVGVMYLGNLVEIGPTDKIYDNPGHPYTVSLLSAIPRITKRGQSERIVLRGPVPSPSDPPSGCRFHTRCPVVVPPESWSNTHNAFLDGFRYYKAIEAGSIDTDDIARRLELENEPENANRIAEYIRQQYFDDLDVYSEKVRNVIQESLKAASRDDNKYALDLLEDLFRSPCETADPNTTHLADGHAAACHRVDPQQESEPIHRTQTQN